MIVGNVAVVESVLYVPLRSPLVEEIDEVVEELVKGSVDAVLSVAGHV